MCATGENPDRKFAELEEAPKIAETMDVKSSDVESLVYVGWSTPSLPSMWELLEPSKIIGMMYLILLLIYACSIIMHKQVTENNIQPTAETEQDAPEDQENPLEEPKFYTHPIMIVIAFYAIPVVKQIIMFYRIFFADGNQDMCFSNLRCSRPYTWISDFNHVYSCIGYILLAPPAFLIIRCQEKSCGYEWRKGSSSELEYVRSKGANAVTTTTYSKVLYALAWTMVFEGLLSGSYHVCPNRFNFYSCKKNCNTKFPHQITKF